MHEPGDEFGLIDAIVEALGDRTAGRWVSVGPGDDCAVITPTANHDVVSSIDTLVESVHFPTDAPPALVGYRALMVSLSDLAAMAADPRYVMVAVSLPTFDLNWVVEFAKGMRKAAQQTDVYVCGGNIARGPLTITISVHGEVPGGQALLRDAACVGDGIFVSGPLGGAAACVRRGSLDVVDGHTLDTLQRAYYCPSARVDLCEEVRSNASAGIDVSDGLVQDLGHILDASGVGAHLDSASIPVNENATRDDALYGGDDYELLCTARTLPSFVRIGEVVSRRGILLDGVEVEARGFNHFVA